MPRGLCCQHVLAMQGSFASGCVLQTLSSEFSSARFSLPVPQGHPLDSQIWEAASAWFPSVDPQHSGERAFSPATSLLASPVKAGRSAFN